MSSGPVGHRSDAPHVVMVVANEVTMDTRVKKEALSLSRAGLRVTVLGLTTGMRHWTTFMGPVPVVRVPVLYRARKAQNAKWARRRRRRPLGIPYRDAEAMAAAKLAAKARSRAIADAAGVAVLDREAGRVSALEYKAGVVSRRVARVLVRGRNSITRFRATTGTRLGKWTGQATEKVSNATQKVTVGARWQSFHAEVNDFEVAYGPVLDSLQPDVIHAHDFHLVRLAARAAGRARLRGRHVAWVYDAHEYVAGMAQYAHRTARWVAAWADLEASYIRRADRVITVSPAIADRLQNEHALTRRPDVVLNVPLPAGAVGESSRSLREDVGLGPDVPLVVFSGGLNHMRGVDTAIRAVTVLPDIHLALVCVPHSRTRYAMQLRALVEELRLAGRVHFLEPVGADELIGYLATADVGLITFLHNANHDMALPNKIFEYISACLPVVVSDLPSLSALVLDAGIGQVFRAGDPDDLARALRTVLEARERFAQAARDEELQRRFSWDQQERVLRNIYRDLLDRPLDEPSLGAPLSATDLVERPRPRTEEPPGPRLLIGPANMAGQGWEWARAVERHLSGVSAETLMVERGGFPFRADTTVAASIYERDVAWQLDQVARVLETITHVLMEAGRPVLGRLRSNSFEDDVPVLRARGIEIAVVVHGSEARSPSHHRELYPWSPFRDPSSPLAARLQEVVDDLVPRLDAFQGPVFVTTPDMLDFLPQAAWLPVVVDVLAWRCDRPVLERAVPVVVHAPSNAELKGSDAVDSVLGRLSREGLVEYQRLQGLSQTEVRQAVVGADVVIDQVNLGNYGVLACEAMAAGRVVVGHVLEHVRARVPGGQLPVVEADPATLDKVMREMLQHREAARQVAESGPAFVREVHDGRRSAEILADFLGVSPPAR